MNTQYNIPIFPFSAIVGQENMKLALILNTIDNKIGGVLIRGEKGTAKSTAVRALAKLLPPIEAVKDCPFHCDPNDRSNLCENCKDILRKGLELQKTKINFSVVNVPLGITEDRLLGTLSIEKVLKDGKKHFEHGLLAQANRHILYIDEVNLLEDHLVDELLDVAAMGVNLVEREGISFSHPSRFILVGTMNPEEGELRPQLLDRFGLCVDVETIKVEKERSEITKRRINFEKSPQKFIKAWEKEDSKLSKRIITARKILTKIVEQDWMYELISKICILADVDGHRADSCILRTGKAYAAWNGKTMPDAKDFLTAASLVLPHRLKKKPFDDEKNLNDLHDKLVTVVKEYQDVSSTQHIVEYKEKKSLHA